MNKNVGKIDRIIRVILSIFLARLVITESVTGPIALLVLAAAAIALTTAIRGTCFLYTKIGFSSNSNKNDNPGSEE